MNAPTPGPPLFTGNEPFGAPALVRQTVLWAGGGPGTGLVIFNEGTTFVEGEGWSSPALNLPAPWGISDLNSGLLFDGGYTLITQPGHPIYAAIIAARFGPNTIGSFSADTGDASSHNLFGTFNAAIFTPTEVVTNSGIVDVGGFGIGNKAPTVPDGTVITLIRECASGVAKSTLFATFGNGQSNGLADERPFSFHTRKPGIRDKVVDIEAVLGIPKAGTIPISAATAPSMRLRVLSLSGLTTMQSMFQRRTGLPPWHMSHKMPFPR